MKSSMRGWVAFASAIVIELFLYGFVANTRSLLIEPICSDLGISRTFFASSMSFSGYLNFAVAYVFATVMERIGLKKTVVIGASSSIVWAALMLAAGFTDGGTSVALIIIAQILLGFVYSWSGLMAIAIVINNWFAHRRNLLMSVAVAAGGLGGAIGSPVVAMLISDYGWRTEMMIMGVLTVVAVVLIALFIKEKPAPGVPLIWENDEKAAAADAKVAARNALDENAGLTLKQALRTKNFWFAMVFLLLLGYSCYPAYVLLAPHISDLGYAEHAGAVTGVMYITNIVAVIVVGYCLDRFGCRKTLTVSFLLTALCMYLLSRPSLSLEMVYAAGVLDGIAFSLLQVTIAAVIRSVFGLKDFARIQSIIFPVSVLGNCTSLTVMSFVAEAFGNSYAPVFYASIFLCFVSILFLFLSTAKIRIKKVEEASGECAAASGDLN